MENQRIRVGFAFCGSFCTFGQVMPQLEKLGEKGYDLYPIFSTFAASTDTRFGPASQWLQRAEKAAGRPPILTIDGAEPIGPKNLLDVVVVAPCTGNTLGKLANGITDTPVTMAVKAHLRNEKPVVLAVSTNDALGAAGRNIGQLLNCRNLYFVPMGQDAPRKKPRSVVANFSLIEEAILAALDGQQLQPILC